MLVLSHDQTRFVSMYGHCVYRPYGSLIVEHTGERCPETDSNLRPISASVCFLEILLLYKDYNDNCM